MVDWLPLSLSVAAKCCSVCGLVGPFDIVACLLSSIARCAHDILLPHSRLLSLIDLILPPTLLRDATFIHFHSFIRSITFMHARCLGKTIVANLLPTIGGPLFFGE